MSAIEHAALRVESRSNQAARMSAIGKLINDAKRQLPVSLRSDRLSWSAGKLSLHRGGQIVATASTTDELITRAIASPVGASPAVRAARAKIRAVAAAAAARHTLASRR